MAMAEQASALIEALQQPGVYAHAVENLTVIETHISWLILTGPYAYKIKKPLMLGFLDFSTLDKRRYYCYEELRLNRRLAPQIYLDVVPITGSTTHPHLSASGTPIEYMVKMVQFPQQSRLDYCLQQGELSPDLIEDLINKVATFHQRTAIAPQDSPYGTPKAVLQSALENFEQMASLLEEESDRRQIARLQQWTQERWRQLQSEFSSRKETGFVRECHGDLHLGNIALVNKNFIIFDCIEFNDNFRWIDVINELAFLVMDLEDRGHPNLAHCCLNLYLEYSGDYSGLSVLNYYQVYRALVRAKIAVIRLGQGTSTTESQTTIKASYRSYLKLASDHIHSIKTFLVITHGLSGSGKTTLSQSFLEHSGAIRLRSDIERKRLHNLKPRERPDEGVAAGIYSKESSHLVYQRLQQLAETVLKAGYPVIVDAAFLKQEQRQTFQNLAKSLEIPFAILDFRCNLPNLRRRVQERQRKNHDASDADLAVLKHQQATQEPLTKVEQKSTLPIETSPPIDFNILTEKLQTLLWD
jgi:aminoglycoside phosphotransferase family enzyme/predicted kinase